MCLLSILFDVIGRSEGVDWSLEEDDVAFVQTLNGAVNGELFETRKARDHGDDFVAPVVAFAHGYLPGV
jgi:hypothetical protein